MEFTPDLGSIIISGNRLVIVISLAYCCADNALIARRTVLIYSSESPLTFIVKIRTPSPMGRALFSGVMKNPIEKVHCIPHGGIW